MLNEEDHTEKEPGSDNEENMEEGISFWFIFLEDSDVFSGM